MLTEINQRSLEVGSEYLIINNKLREVFRVVLAQSSDIKTYMKYIPLEIINDDRGYITRYYESEIPIWGSKFDKFYTGEFNKEDIVAEVI